MKDELIIEKIKKGDESALEYLYRKNFTMILRSIQKKKGSEADAKDIYQDALIILWEKVASGNFVLTSKISTFLYGVCNNLWKKENDRRQKLSYEEKDGVAEGPAHRQEQIDAITECIEEMSEACQQILTMYYFDKMSMIDIAHKLDLSSADTAKTKKYRCKKQLDKLVLSKYKATDFLD